MRRKHLTAITAVLCSILAFAPSTANAQDSNDKTTPAPWSTFKYPTIVVIDKDNDATKGSALVHKLIPDLDTFIQKIALGVCEKLYKNAREVPVFDQLTFELEHYDGIAGKSGQPPRIRIKLSTKYLEAQYERMGDEAITYEIAGVNWHELTHGYQHVPQNAGDYRRGTDHFGFIEGTADAVRILAGYHKTRKAMPGGHWTDGYTTTGFFIVWLAENRDPEFLYKLNQSCKTIAPWSWDGACKSIFGEETSVARLWDEYQWHLKGGGKEAVANFDPEIDLICKGQSIQFNNTSFNSPVSYEWTFEGGTPATSTQMAPVVSYDKPGEYPVSLVATNEHGPTTKHVRSCIHVLDRTGNVISLTELGGRISHESEAPAMPREGVGNLLDQDPRSKFCLQASRTQIQYVVPGKYELYSYAFTSANDAPGRDPEDWTLEASNDGTDWTVVDRQEGQVFKNRHQAKPFVVNCKTAYKYYRWNLEAKSEQIFQFADLEMFGIKEN
jgi:PKD repeat protein